MTTILIYVAYSVLILCVSILVWTYVIYPLVVAVLAKSKRLLIDPLHRPFFSVMIPAYNEEAAIRKKIENTLSLQYPKDKKEILVVDDGSADETANIVSEFPDVKLVRLARRQGKSGAINVGIERASGDAIVLTDADCLLEEGALFSAAQYFADPRIGAVAGWIADKGKKPPFLRDFVKRESWLALNESLLDSIPTGTGGFLAFRKHLVNKLNPECLADDVEISVKVRSKGYRVIWSPEVKGTTWAPDFKLWFKQTIRRTLQGLTTLFRYKFIFFRPKFGWFGMITFPTRLFFHRLSPFLLVLAFLSLWLISPILTLVMLIFALFLTLLVPLARKMFIIQIVFLCSWAIYLSRKYDVVWERGPRTTEEVSD